jgi:hypothetical protein
MCSRSRDIKYTCICSSAWPNLLSSAHITTGIFILSFIIHLYTARARLITSRNTIYLGVLFLTVRMRDFPLSYEGVSEPAIEAVRHAYRIYYKALQFILGRSGRFSILFSSWAWFPPRPTLYRHNENRYRQSDFCALLISIIRLILWSFVWFQWLFPSQHVFDPAR